MAPIYYRLLLGAEPLGFDGPYAPSRIGGHRTVVHSLSVAEVGGRKDDLREDIRIYKLNFGKHPTIYIYI